MFRNLIVNFRLPRASVLGRPIRRRLQLESLEDRKLLSATPNLVMDTLTRLDSTSIQYQYEVQNAPVTESFPVNFYRSSDATLDPSDILIGADTVTPAQATVGTHVSPVAHLTMGFAPDPLHKYILAVAMPPAGVTSTDDTADLRTYILGVVTHGDAPTGQFPCWVTDMADELVQTDLYDAAIPFDWAKIAALPLPGTAKLAADLMTDKVLATIAQVAPQGSWDLQIIGHSRGGSVISLAMDKLISMNVSQLNGYKRLTYLDSHPANAATDSLFNYPSFPSKGWARGLAAYRVAVQLQHAINDPDAFVPVGVDYAEAYYQQGLASQVVYQKLEAVLNLWGENNIAAPAGLTVHYVNLTVPGMSHTGVWRLYTRSIVQSLITALPTETTFAPPKPYDLRPLDCEKTPTVPKVFNGGLAQIGLITDHLQQLFGWISLPPGATPAIAGATLTQTKTLALTPDTRSSVLPRLYNVEPNIGPTASFFRNLGEKDSPRAKPLSRAVDNALAGDLLDLLVSKL
jgi:hypothetical protein